MRREFFTTLVTRHVLGQELSVQPASEDDVIHELRRVFSATSTIFLELRPGGAICDFVADSLLWNYCYMSNKCVGDASLSWNLYVLLACR